MYQQAIFLGALNFARYLRCFGRFEKSFGKVLFRRGNYRLNCLKGAPPPEVAASVEHAVTAVKKHAKPSVKTRDFFIFVISLVTKDIFILRKIFDFMTFKISFVKLIIQPLFWICQIKKKTFLRT